MIIAAAGGMTITCVSDVVEQADKVTVKLKVKRANSRSLALSRDVKSDGAGGFSVI